MKFNKIKKLVANGREEWELKDWAIIRYHLIASGKTLGIFVILVPSVL